MTAIMLSGPGRRGKTTTLNILYSMLLSNGGLSQKRSSLGADKNDFSDIVLYKTKKIEIYTMGDFSRDVTRVINNYSVNQEIDMLIVACNNQFKLPYRKITTFKEYEIVEKSISSETNLELQVNTKDAEYILSIINKHLN